MYALPIALGIALPAFLVVAVVAIVQSVTAGLRKAQGDPVAHTVRRRTVGATAVACLAALVAGALGPDAEAAPAVATVTLLGIGVVMSVAATFVELTWPRPRGSVRTAVAVLAPAVEDAAVAPHLVRRDPRGALRGRRPAGRLRRHVDPRLVARRRRGAEPLPGLARRPRTAHRARPPDGGDPMGPARRRGPPRPRARARRARHRGPDGEQCPAAAHRRDDDLAHGARGGVVAGSSLHELAQGLRGTESPAALYPPVDWRQDLAFALFGLGALAGVLALAAATAPAHPAAAPSAETAPVEVHGLPRPSPSTSAPRRLRTSSCGPRSPGTSRPASWCPVSGCRRSGPSPATSASPPGRSPVPIGSWRPPASSRPAGAPGRWSPPGHLPRPPPFGGLPRLRGYGAPVRPERGRGPRPRPRGDPPRPHPGGRRGLTPGPGLVGGVTSPMLSESSTDPNSGLRDVEGPTEVGSPSSSGPGPRPFTAVARVRIPLGIRTCFSQGPVARWLARRPLTAEVAGSSPVGVAPS